jgi:hypothetical protein
MAEADQSDSAAELIPSRWAPYAMATVHPSSLLRAPDEAPPASAICSKVKL